VLEERRQLVGSEPADLRPQSEAPGVGVGVGTGCGVGVGVGTGCGVVAGVALAEFDGEPVPAAFVARTVKVYFVPFVRPVTE
jgi:hypothetical protein